MKDSKLHLFIIKNLLDKRDAVKVEKSFMKLLDPEDFSYMATVNRDDNDVFVCTFEADKIKILENLLFENGVLLESKDISESALSFNYCEELQLIVNDNYDNKFIVERFIVRNLDLDKVLDKICDNGIESLNRLEKKFLSRLS
jgi:hypothetical protein